MSTSGRADEHQRASIRASAGGCLRGPGRWMSKNEHRRSISGQDEHQADHEQPCSLPAQNGHASFLAQLALAHRHSVQNFGMPVLALCQCASCANIGAPVFWHCASVLAVPTCWHAGFLALCRCASCANIGTQVLWHCASVPAVPKFWHASF